MRASSVWAGIRVVDPAHSIGDAVHVGVHADAGQPESEVAHEVRGLPSHPGQRQQLLHVRWYRAGMLFQEDPRSRAQAPGFRVVEACRVDELFDAACRKGSERRGSRRGGEQRLRGATGHLVLGPQGDHGCHEHAERVAVLPRHLGHRRQRLAAARCCPGAAPWRGKSGSRGCGGRGLP